MPKFDRSYDCRESEDDFGDNKQPPPIAARVATIPRRHDNDNPLWRGPCGAGPLGGVTQSMLVRFFSCRERFRLKYVLGLEPHDRWNHRLGYGNMWHACEEALAKCDASGCGSTPLNNWHNALIDHTNTQLLAYPTQGEEIHKWHCVCAVQFPEYVQYWRAHSDVSGRTPLMQEKVFDVDYQLPSGRTVRLRGKFDSVDLIEAHVDENGQQWPTGIWLQENKTKGDIDKVQVERQLKFDLQTMMYLIALHNYQVQPKQYRLGGEGIPRNVPILGVRYNVVRRPLSGGKGSIRPHAAKFTKNTSKPAETDEEFYERLRRDYLAAEPDYWFFRVRAEISEQDIQVFRDTCLDPLLETLCWWYDEVTGNVEKVIEVISEQHDLYHRVDRYKRPPMNYRTPFGVYSALEEGGATEYDAFLETGSEAGLRRVNSLFPELQ